MTNIYPNY